MAGKKEIAEMVAHTLRFGEPQIELSQAQAEAVIDAVTGAITKKLHADGGEPVQLRGFGTFKPVQRKPRMSRNPKTGETFQTPAKTVIKFKELK